MPLPRPRRRSGVARWALVLPVGIALGAACSAPGKPDEVASSPTATATATTTATATATATATPRDAASASSPAGTTGDTSSAPASGALPPAAGASAAAAAAGLPAGPGSGPVVITYDGLGEADSTFVGQCTHDGPVTTLSGSAGSATVDLVFDPGSVTLTVTDVGLGSSAAGLARGDLTVLDGHLRLTAPLLSAGEVIGSLFLDITCGR